MKNDHPLGEPDPIRLRVAQRPYRGRVNSLDRRVAGELAKKLAHTNIVLVLWDGTEFGRIGEPGPRVRIHDRAGLYRLLYPQTQLAELYTAGRVDIEGNLLEMLEQGARTIYENHKTRPWLNRLSRLSWGTPSERRARRNIHHHYDLGNDFYRMWLDAEGLQYTCAYYPHEDFTLEQAQVAKMDHVCRKLWLSPGDTVVEAGCGWGGFAIHMAKRYGVKVRAFNISHEQILYAREWAQRENVANLVEFVEDDYRNINSHYDVFVSIGMLEHVGPGNYEQLGHLIQKCLKANGRGLIHTIGRDRPAPLNRWIRKRIFPGAYPPTLREMSDIFEPSGLSVLDVENLRLHYAQTLKDWLVRFENHQDEVREMFDEAFVRAWRFYLAGSAASFLAGSVQLFQVVFARTGWNKLPMSRAHVYADDPIDDRRRRIRSVN